MTDWSKSAERENRRRDREAPLFASVGLVPHTTADEQEAKVRRTIDDLRTRLELLAVEMIERARRYRLEVAAVTTPEELAALDTKWIKAYSPGTPEYLADYWHQAKRRHGLCDVGCLC